MEGRFVTLVPAADRLLTGGSLVTRDRIGEPDLKGRLRVALPLRERLHAPSRVPNDACSKGLRRPLLLSTWTAVNPGDRPYRPRMPQLSDSQGHGQGQKTPA